MSRNKYNAKKVNSPDGVFDSRKEHRRWIELQGLQEMGAISELKRQVSYTLIPDQELKNPRVVGKNHRLSYMEKGVNYVADFVYKRDGETIVEDVKGYKTSIYTIKRKLMLFIYGIEVREV